MHRRFQAGGRSASCTGTREHHGESRFQTPYDSGASWASKSIAASSSTQTPCARGGCTWTKVKGCAQRTRENGARVRHVCRSLCGSFRICSPPYTVVQFSTATLESHKHYQFTPESGSHLPRRYCTVGRSFLLRAWCAP